MKIETKISKSFILFIVSTFQKKLMFATLLGVYNSP
jgi:hypothetical protein